MATFADDPPRIPPPAIDPQLTIEVSMKKTALAAVVATVLAGSAFADEGQHPAGITPLDHVFLIVMENHGFSQILNNPNAPFINQYAKSANLATNYFAIGHPSLTNYLEIVGGSNFGVRADNFPDWHNTSCVPNLRSGVANTDNPPSPAVCPISGVGMDAATPAVDTTNEISNPGDVINDIDGIQFLNAAPTIGMTIGDQLTAHSLEYKSYQESLPLQGADRVNFSDGFYTDSTDFTTITPTLTPPLSQSDVVALYAVKHNPFAYFANVQRGTNPRNSLANSVGFDGAGGLYADLASGDVPELSFIVPNQCNDQHGRGNAGAFCNFDPNDNGTQAGLNPALIQRGDVTVQKLVGAIKASPAWKQGHNAIVLVWDENDYSVQPIVNQVMAVVDTNYGAHGVHSNVRYNHFSLLKTMEAGFQLPCLNHACDSNVPVMNDLFAR
jgi:hypothetical protein